MAPERIVGLFLALIFWASASLAGPLLLVVISDLNSSYGSTTYNPRITTAINRIIEMKPDLVISTGDMVAGQRRPHLSKKEVRAMWASFHKTVSDPLAKAGIPFAVTPGNHDASAYGGFKRERQIFRDEWSKRKPDLAYVDDDNYPFFYAFDLQGVRFVSLDATTLGPLRDGQDERLKGLATDGRLLVTFSHLPLWPVAQGREKEIIGDKALEALFLRLDVQMHLSGHHHAYYPGRKDGMLYVAQANLGGTARKLIGETRKGPASFTVLEFEADGQVKVSALRAPDFRTEVDLKDLPKQIQFGDAALTRMDLKP